MPEVPNDGPHFTTEVTTVTSEVSSVQTSDITYVTGDFQNLDPVVEIVGSAATPVLGT